MFSNVNEVVQQCYLAETGNYRFVIDWSASCYRDPAKTKDTWLYYFNACFDEIDLSKLNPQELTPLVSGVPVACCKDNIITPRLRDKDCNPLLLPSDRSLANRYVQRYIKPKLSVRRHVDKFARKHFRSEMIGLHIRGPGRTDGGAQGMRANHTLTFGVPLDMYFDAVDSLLQRQPSLAIFACSDSSVVIDHVVKRYGSKVIVYDATRSKFGEMHASHPQNHQQSFDRHKLGMDVLVEAYLLARCTYFIHGNSNVANFVLCRSPQLRNHYVYG